MNTDIRTLAAHLNNNVKEAITQTKSFERTKVKIAIASIDDFVRETSGQHNKHYAKTRKALLPLRNTLSGVLDSESQKSMSSTITRYMPNIDTYLNNFATEFKVAQKSESARGLRIGLDDDVQDAANDALREAMINNQDVEMLNQFVNAVRVLPKEIDDGFEVIRSPILPSFKKLIKMDDAFDKAKIAYDKIDFYYILKNQMLIAINSRQHSTKPERFTYIMQCLDTINDAGNTQYELVTDIIVRHPNPDRHVMFAWIMERNQFNRIFTIAGSFSISEWSFPTNFKHKGNKGNKR